MNLKHFFLNRQDKKRIRQFEKQLKSNGKDIAWVNSKYTHLYGETISIGNNDGVVSDSLYVMY